MCNTKKLFKYLLPSVGAMLVTSLYMVVDGIFVGNGVGAIALASVNIAVPYISIVLALTMMVTMGGATLTSIAFGKGDNYRANMIFRYSVYAVFAFSFLMTIISVSIPEHIAKLFGASDTLLKDTATYIRFYVLFCVFFCLAMTLSAFVRNDGNPRLAFWGMLVGGVSNIFLDWLFIYPLKMEVMGAAIASGLGQVLSCAILSIHFILKKGNLRIGRVDKDFKLVLDICRRGIPEFVTQLSQPVVIFCYNLVVQKYYGDIGVSAFSIISYLVIIVIGVFTGVSQGIQPLISYSVGEENKKNEQFFFYSGLIINFVLSVIMYLTLFFGGEFFIRIFNKDIEIVNIAYNCVKIYGISFIFASINIIITTYLLSKKATVGSVTVALLRSVVFSSLFIFTTPIMFGEKSIWAGIIIAEILTLFVGLGIVLYQTLKKKENKQTLINE